MRARLIRKLVGSLRRWPLHPQWLLSVRSERKALAAALRELHGLVVDIGCADKRLALQLPDGCTYLGLDYPATATSMYRTNPDVFADARALPFSDASVDAVILKDVLEHVPEPDTALSEIGRVLIDGGTLVLWIPFIYPVHDAPFDFQRFTEFGLRDRLAGNYFSSIKLQYVLSPIETGALMTCLACADAAEQILLRRKWLAPIVLLLSAMVLLTNIFAKLISWIPATSFMPAFYRIVAKRDERQPQ